MYQRKFGTVFWEDVDGWCYGNYLEDKLMNAGIVFDAYYADVKE